MEWYYIVLIVYWVLCILTLIGHDMKIRTDNKKNYLWYWIVGLYVVIAFPIGTPIVLVKEWIERK